MTVSPAQVAKRIDNLADEYRRVNGSRRKPTRLPFRDWAEKYATIREQPLNLAGHEYLGDIYSDVHPYEIYRKAAQVGISTKCLLEALWMCDRYNAKVLYYMATDGDAGDFSNDRISTTIDDSNYLTQLLQERERGRDNVGLRHIAKGSLYCRGMFTKKRVKSVDADALILDELDEADQENKRFALDRILHSPLQVVRELSQPSIPDYGIDETFQRSDQRFWHLKCPKCNEWTCLDLDPIEEAGRIIPRAILEIPEAMRSQFPEDQKYFRACLHCHSALDMSQGEWIALHPSRQERRGYHISQLYRQQGIVGFADPADWIMDQLMGARKTSEKMRVTISILGLPYAGDRAPITDASLDAAEGDHGFWADGQGCYMGIDQGDELHISIGADTPHGRLQAVYFETTEDWGRVLKLGRQFGARCCVGDANPNKAKIKEVARDAPFPFYIQYFAGDTQKEGEEGKDERAVKKVTVDRTESLDDTVGSIVSRDILLPRLHILDAEETRTMEDVRGQLKMLVKDLVENAKGVKTWAYKTNVPNHYGMALNSMRIARSLAPISGSVVSLDTDIMAV